MTVAATPRPPGKLARLRSMGRNELLHRVRERLGREADRARARLLPAAAPGDRFVRELAAGGHDTRGSAARRYLEQSAAPRFYLPVSSAARRRLFETVRERFPEGVDAGLDEARRLAEGKVPLLGFGEVDLGPQIDWHRDPVSGVRWPRRFAADYDLASADNPADPKVIHELNRHQHLPRLAKAWALTGEHRFAAAALDQLDAWIDQNPESQGINWSSSLEMAIRGLSWLWTIFLLLPCASLSEERSRRLLGSLFTQLDHVARYPSRYSSPNTHVIGEAAALFVAGETFADLPSARAWKQRGLELLAAEILRQDVEGVHAELSCGYHCYAVDFYLQATAVGRANSTVFPERFQRRLEAEIAFIANLTRADGTLPALGDDDGGRALALASQDYRSFADALSTGAVLFERPDWRWVAGELREETVWLLGPAAVDAWKRIEANRPLRRHDYRPGAGYFAQRSGWGPRQAHLVFDCGGLGFLGGGHGHADALSIALHGPEGDILVDPGTFVYNLAPAWRDWFRSTAAHNTVVVDGRSQSEPAGTFRWGPRAGVSPGTGFSAPFIEHLEGEHDGYAGLPGAPRHRRRILQVGGEYWLVLDDLLGAGEHDLELLYHFPPERHPLRLQEDPGGGGLAHVTSDAAGSLFGITVCGSSPLAAEVIHGREEPPQGWVSRRYGERSPAPVLRAALAAPLPARFVSVLAPGGSALARGRDERRYGALPPDRFATDSDGAAADGRGEMVIRRYAAGDAGDVVLSIERRGHTDWLLVSSGDHDVQIGETRLRGEAVWLRVREGEIERFFARNASFVEHRGEPLLESERPVACCAREARGNRSRPGGTESSLGASGDNPVKANAPAAPGRG